MVWCYQGAQETHGRKRKEQSINLTFSLATPEKTSVEERSQLSTSDKVFRISHFASEDFCTVYSLSQNLKINTAIQKFSI